MSLFSGRPAKTIMMRASVFAALSLSGPVLVHAEEADKYHEIESRYIFGFVTGSDIGAEGEKEIESETNGSFGKRGGSSTALDQELAFEFVPTQFLLVELAGHGVYHGISDVDGLDNIHRADFGGLSANFQFLLAGRGPGSPVGLAISTEPAWARIDDVSGQRTTSFGNEVKLIADTELIPNRLYYAVNLQFEAGAGLEHGLSTWSRSSALGVGTALAYRVAPRVTLGAELQYFRGFDGLDLSNFAGNALYLGPTLHIQVSHKIFLAAAFEAQVTGHAAGEARSLDLTNFERYRARLKFGVEF